MGALDYLSDVIVYYINVSTNKPPSRWLTLVDVYAVRRTVLQN